ncbi:MAG: polyphosphate polymerase domain-containing protein [SAR324 cluster bacterium]|nr:polyphosphate polymerase domain-containing protein [SAR324 cluster bacterium]
MKNLEVKRHELKYYINNLGYHELVGRLSHVLPPDPHSTPYEGYYIRSLYFDSHDDECLFEKQAGIKFRVKYRMRIYDTNSEVVKFEIKNRWNNQIFKETATISKASAYKIIDGDYGELLTYENPVLNKIFIAFSRGHYRPKLIIDYDRDAFMFDFFNLRITVDKNLRANNSDFDLFSSSMHTIPVVLEGKQILEIKYENCLPQHIQQCLQLDAFERQAISKYTLGRRYNKSLNWEDN